MVRYRCQKDAVPHATKLATVSGGVRDHQAIVLAWPSSTVDKFWSRVNVDGPVPGSRPDLGPCWQWTGIVNVRYRYGYYNDRNVFIRAPRAAYILTYRRRIPDGMVVDHLCRNTVCVNPAHLDVVTNRENTIRGNARHNGENNRAKTHCPKGHSYAEHARLFGPRMTWRSCRECERTRVRSAQ